MNTDLRVYQLSADESDESDGDDVPPHCLYFAVDYATGNVFVAVDSILTDDPEYKTKIAAAPGFVYPADGPEVPMRGRPYVSIGGFNDEVSRCVRENLLYLAGYFDARREASSTQKPGLAP